MPQLCLLGVYHLALLHIGYDCATKCIPVAVHNELFKLHKLSVTNIL